MPLLTSPVEESRISAGYYHSLVLKSDVTVAGWGQDADGAVTAPKGLTGVTAVVAGGNFSLALESGGSVTGWGSNSDGCLTFPAALKNVIAIDAGGAFALVIVPNS
jgi:alpha-tubulin suppressor-like RCC1 family protein